MTGSFDVTALNRLAKDLGALALEAQPNVLQAVNHTALAIKDAWNSKLYTEGSARRTGGAITYTVTEGVDGIGADIGAVRGSGRQAGVVRLLENGSVHNPPHGYGSAALGESEADFEARIAFGIWAAQQEHGL